MDLRRVVICAVGAPLLLGAAAEPMRLQPQGPWDVDYAESSCRLIRTFGEGETQTKLGFESTGPDSMDMLVVGKPLRTSAEQASARFLPVGSKSFEGMVVTAVGSGDPAVLWSSVPMLPASPLAQVEREQEEQRRNPGVRPPAVSVAEQELRHTQRQQFADAVTELKIETSRHGALILETGSLGRALAAFDKCSRDSLKDWGVDPAVDEKIVRPPWALNPATWLSSNDYPNDMLMNGKESNVDVRLLVDAAGKITKCTSLSHFAEEEFNRITCDKLSRRARLEPAELADGTKVPSYYIFLVKFRIAH